MTAQTAAGWTALGAGVLLLASIAASSMAMPAAVGGNAIGHAPMGPGMMNGGGMGPGMMNGGGMGPGMMGFGNAGPASTAIPGATEARVQAANFSFTPSEIRLPAGVGVNLTLVNPSGTGVMHDLTVPALGIHLVANAGETRTIGLRLAAGRYDAICSVPGHAELGMRATLIVE